MLIRDRSHRPIEPLETLQFRSSSLPIACYFYFAHAAKMLLVQRARTDSLPSRTQNTGTSPRTRQRSDIESAQVNNAMKTPSMLRNTQLLQLQAQEIRRYKQIREREINLEVFTLRGADGRTVSEFRCSEPAKHQTEVD